MVRGNPPRRLLRAYAAGDKARVRGIGGAWLARRLWKEVLAGEAAKGADRGAQGAKIG